MNIPNHIYRINTTFKNFKIKFYLLYFGENKMTPQKDRKCGQICMPIYQKISVIKRCLTSNNKPHCLNIFTMTIAQI